MSYKEKLRDTFEAMIDYLPIVILYATLLTLVISTTLVIFFGRSDLEKLSRYSFYFLVGMMASGNRSRVN